MATVKNEKTCIVCGEKYSFCPRCADELDKPSWYGIFCSENCKDIYDTTLLYGEGALTKAEAKTALNKLDLSKKDNFHPVIKARANEILGIKETKKNYEEDVEG